MRVWVFTAGAERGVQVGEDWRVWETAGQSGSVSFEGLGLCMWVGVKGLKRTF